MWLIWLIAAIVFVLSDMHLQAFYAVFVGLGAVAACIAAALGADLWLQGVFFAGAAALGIALVRPPLARWLDRRSGRLTVIPGTHGGFVGQQTVTLDEVGDETHPGHVQLGNEQWLAITDAPIPLPKGTRVQVMALRGTTMLVRPAKSEEVADHG